jgi:hypothetical protein
MSGAHLQAVWAGPGDGLDCFFGHIGPVENNKPIHGNHNGMAQVFVCGRASFFYSAYVVGAGRHLTRACGGL